MRKTIAEVPLSQWHNGLKKQPESVENWEPANVRGLSTPCHDCISHKTHFGYPRFLRDGKQRVIHRFLFEEKFGKVADDLVIRHKCDNRRCINLDHLEIGTRADNTRDMVERGRGAKPKGEKNPFRKLTERQVRFIILCREKGVKLKFLATQFNVTMSAISLIGTRKNWSHLNA